MFKKTPYIRAAGITRKTLDAGIGVLKEKPKTKIHAGTLRLTHEGSMCLAMEWGYIACEQGMNIQRAKQEFNKVLREGIL